MKPLSGWFRRRETPEVPEERATSVHGRGLALHHAQTSISRSALSLWGEGPDGLSWRFRGSEPLGSQKAKIGATELENGSFGSQIGATELEHS